MTGRRREISKVAIWIFDTKTMTVVRLDDSQDGLHTNPPSRNFRPRRQSLYSASCAALFGGCSDELKKENSDWRAPIEAFRGKRKPSIVVALATKSTRWMAEKSGSADSKKPEDSYLRKFLAYEGMSD